jgi:hypothetical protein
MYKFRSPVFEVDCKTSFGLARRRDSLLRHNLALVIMGLVIDKYSQRRVSILRSGASSYALVPGTSPGVF